MREDSPSHLSSPDVSIRSMSETLWASEGERESGEGQRDYREEMEDDDEERRGRCVRRPTASPLYRTNTVTRSLPVSAPMLSRRGRQVPPVFVLTKCVTSAPTLFSFYSNPSTPAQSTQTGQDQHGSDSRRRYGDEEVSLRFSCPPFHAPFRQKLITSACSRLGPPPRSRSTAATSCYPAPPRPPRLTSFINTSSPYPSATSPSASPSTETTKASPRPQDYPTSTSSTAGRTSTLVSR